MELKLALLCDCKHKFRYTIRPSNSFSKMTVKRLLTGENRTLKFIK